ncbi:MAG: NADH:ubiquinone reductase (Na(+)-transporting) subunit A, partial [Paludibacteraceae bacterium]|nr:NADH:ubiquinone reductase (Na(+)-transporting) subunit A [Paludibacteraceae bacterium]
CNAHKELALRYICGNVLSGTQKEANEVICYRANQITIIAEGTEKHEFMGWLLPRFNDFNATNTDPAKMLDNGLWHWLFGPKKYNWDARVKGGRRAIIVSGEYDKVFPMDIYPEQLIKAMIAGNIDKMEQLGAYEVAPEDFALCEYMCTSKMPLQAIVSEALANLRKEVE